MTRNSLRHALSRLALPRTALVPVLAGIGLLAASCTASPPTRFYTLTPIAPIEAGPGPDGKAVSLAVGPVMLPPYLDRAEVVTRMSDNRLEVSNVDRWGEPLDPLFSRTLRENLSLLLRSQNIYAMPNERRVSFDHQIEVDVLQFEASATAVVLDARWRLYGSDGDNLRRTERFAVTLPLDDWATTDQVVEAMSRAVGDLARSIADAVMPEPPKPPRRPTQRS